MSGVEVVSNVVDNCGDSAINMVINSSFLRRIRCKRIQ